MVTSFHTLCPTSTAGSPWEAAYYVRTSRRLVWSGPSVIPQWTSKVRDLSTALSQPLWYVLCSEIDKPPHYFWCLVNINMLCPCFLCMRLTCLHCLVEFSIFIHFLLFYFNEIKRVQGWFESEWETNIKMWENVARSNVDYLLLWQWVPPGCRTHAISK